MRQIDFITRDPLTQRDLYFTALSRPQDLLTPIHLSSPHFFCFLAWDVSQASVEEISAFVEPLLRAGGAYFCVGGPGCERVHDIIDELDAEPDSDLASPEGGVRMTTWHAEESLEEALLFFLEATEMDAMYEATASSALVIAVGADAWAAQLRAALEDPRAFVARSE